MSKIFYDRIMTLEKVEKELSKIATSKEEKQELEMIVDEYIHHRMMGCILDKLPHDHHEHFLTQFSEAPHHEGLWKFLSERVPEDIENFLREEAVKIGEELLEVIKGKKTSK